MIALRVGASDAFTQEVSGPARRQSPGPWQPQRKLESPVHSTIPPRDRATTPAPAPVSPELATYLAASERAASALRELDRASRALQARAA